MSKTLDQTTKIFEQVRQCKTDKELEDLLVEINLISTGLLRGLRGDQFVHDFLTAAVNCKDPLTLKLVTKH